MPFGNALDLSCTTLAASTRPILGTCRPSEVQPSSCRRWGFWIPSWWWHQRVDERLKQKMGKYGETLMFPWLERVKLFQQLWRDLNLEGDLRDLRDLRDLHFGQLLAALPRRSYVDPPRHGSSLWCPGVPGLPCHGGGPGRGPWIGR